MVENIILVAVIIVILFGAAFYIYRQKKKGNHCIGCPYSKECHKKSCCCENKENDKNK